MDGEKADYPHSTGNGTSNYTSGGTIEPYDLSNWKWISVVKDEIELLVSLQCFDCDPNTGNKHILMDRIGIYACAKGQYVTNTCEKEMKNTGIDLPMDCDKYILLMEKLKKMQKK